MALMGIDIGSSGCKCAAFAVDGTLLALEKCEYQRPTNATEFDGEDIWQRVAGLVPLVVHKAGQPIEAVSVASIGEAFAPIGKDGAPLYPFLQSTSPKGADYQPEVDSAVGDRIRQITGVNPLARYSLTKMVYLYKRHPDIVHSAWKYMMLEDFIIFRLCGEAVSEYSVASRSAAFDVSAKRYDNEILAIAGIDPSIMCTVQPTGSVAGTVRPEVAGELGLSSSTLVVLGGHDTIPENLSSGLLTTGMVSLGCGTFEGVGVLVQDRRNPDPDLLRNNFSREPYPLPGMELINGINPNGGNCIRWFRDQFGEMEKTTAAHTGESSYALLDRLASSKPTDLLVVPHLLGSGTPEFSQRARGTIAGLQLSTTRGDVYRAFLEGVAYEMANIVDAFQRCGMEITRAVASSGGANSLLWTQIRADVLGIPFTTLGMSNTTLSGCAMLAGMGAGVYKDAFEAAGVFVKQTGTIQPDPDRHEFYQSQLARYKRLRSVLLEEWNKE